MINYRSIALFILVGFAATFESTRTSLWILGDVVGGVGGWGGLTGIYNPQPSCNRTAAFVDKYCFNAGAVAGLTPYAIITTLFWVSPLFVLGLGGLVESWKGACPLAPTPTATNEGEEEASESEHHLAVFKFIWYLLSFLWFINPLCAFCSSPFYQENFSMMILAISLAASYPLSWCAMLVSLPMNSTLGVISLLGLNKHHLREAHMTMARWTGFWVLLHGLGELVYLAIVGRLWSSLALGEEPDNLLFVFGLITLVFGVVHGFVAYFRGRWYFIFRRVHLPMAMALLFTATIHWWPFAFFLLPAITTHALEFAKKKFMTKPSARTESLGLLCASSGSLVALCITWSLRATYMMRADATRYTPYLFSAVGFVLCFCGAFSAACAVFIYTNRSERLQSSEEEVQMCWK